MAISCAHLNGCLVWPVAGVVRSQTQDTQRASRVKNKRQALISKLRFKYKILKANTEGNRQWRSRLDLNLRVKNKTKTKWSTNQRTMGTNETGLTQENCQTVIIIYYHAYLPASRIRVVIEWRLSLFMSCHLPKIQHSFLSFFSVKTCFFPLVSAAEGLSFTA